MPKFKLTLDDGRSIVVTADNQADAVSGAEDWARNNPSQPKPKSFGRKAAEYVTGAAASLNRGLGIGDELAAGANALVETAKARPSLQELPNALATNFSESMKRQRGIEDQFARERPISAPALRGLGMGATALLPMGQTLSTSNALLAGARAGTAAAVQGAAYSLADRGTAQERIANANRSIVPSFVVGGALGAGGQMLANARAPKPPVDPTEEAASVLRDRARADANAMTARADQMRDAGVEPNALDVIGARGERMVRAAGARFEDAGEELTKNARRAVANTKPGAMEATRGIIDDARTPNALMTELEDARAAAARTDYAPAYAKPVEVGQDVRSALSGRDGREAIGRAIRAAEARRDTEALSDLYKLQTFVNRRRAGVGSNVTGSGLAQEQWPQVSAAALDRIQIALGKRAETLAANQSGDIAAGLYGRRASINSALDQVPELGPARQAYKQTSQAIDLLAGERPDPVSTNDVDYAAWLQSLSPEARQANAVAVRQDILDGIGGTKQNSFGSLDTLTTGDYIGKNLRAVFGEEAASDLIRNVETRLAQTRRATMVTPGAGSRTAILEPDMNKLGQAAEVAKEGLQFGANVANANVVGIVGQAANWFRTRGMTEDQAMAVVREVTDPQRLDALIAAIERQSGPQESRSFLETIVRSFADDPPRDPQMAAIAQKASDLLSRSVGSSVSAPKPAVEAWAPESPQYGVGRAY